MVEMKKQGFRKYIFEGKFGLEKESLRVTEEGFLANTKHPFSQHPYIEKDFCENQVELITKVCNSIDEVYEELCALHNEVTEKINTLQTGPEYLWPFSNPPYIRGEEDIWIAEYEENRKGKEQYRKYLAKKYGKKKMLFSGIHFNYSFSEDFLKALYQLEGKDSFFDYRNQCYLKLTKQVLRYSWFLVYLTAASSVLDGSFLRSEWMGMDMHKNYASIRCSENGYWNHFLPILSYDNLYSYVDSIEKYIRGGQLREVSELYYPVRIKPKGGNELRNFQENGISHIELRMLDVNPFSFVGIMKEDLAFLHYFLVYLFFQKDIDFGVLEQTEAIHNEKKAALFEEETFLELGWKKVEKTDQEALCIIENMENFYKDFFREDIKQCLLYQRKKIENPNLRYAHRVREEFGENYVKKGILQAKKYAGRERNRRQK